MDDFLADRRRLIGAGVILAGAGMAAACAKTPRDGTAAPQGDWKPSPEKLDAWLDKAGTRHRMMFDSVSGDGGSEALGFANNFIHVNEADYGLKAAQLGVVIIFRHMSTPFGYNNAVWAKYGKNFADKMGLKGDMAKRAATMNPALVKAPGGEPPPKGMEWTADSTLSDLAAKGVHFAVCGLATKGIAAMIAGKKGDAAAVETELKSNLVPNAVIVPAGISAVNRAQEHGYTFAFAG